MSVVELAPASSRASALRERLEEMRDDLVDRMVRRGNPEPAHLPMLAGIEATLRVLDGKEIAAPDNRPPELAPTGSAMATADPDGEHVRLDLDVSGARLVKARPAAGVAARRRGLGGGRLGDATDAYRARRAAK